jgi:hypothetical protein
MVHGSEMFMPNNDNYTVPLDGFSSKKNILENKYPSHSK